MFNVKEYASENPTVLGCIGLHLSHRGQGTPVFQSLNTAPGTIQLQEYGCLMLLQVSQTCICCSGEV